MSQVQSVRLRSQRSAAAAVERARLTVVANRPPAVPRAPFAVLVFLILGAGVVGLLMFNTQMQQASIHATQLQAKADKLQAESQALGLALQRKRDPQQVAVAARKLGMVAPETPAMISLSDGKILGIATPATAQDAVKLLPAPPAKPRLIDPPADIQFVTAKPPPTTNEQTRVKPGTASTPNRTRADTNRDPNNRAQGAPR